MSEQSTGQPKQSKDQSSLPFIKRSPPPALTAATFVVILALLGWWAQINGLLPGFDKWRMKQDQKKMYGLAARVSGDYSKLSEDERKWVEEKSNGHGKMTMMMYGSKRK